MISKASSDTALDVIAESPRKAILENPAVTAGMSRIAVNEGNTQTEGPFRNLKIDLTAPKTNLLKGESTVLHIQVLGLEGVKGPVPMTLTASGVITMEGGATQQIVITPSQVGSNGSYVTTRKITGSEAGGWTATATVIIR